MLAAQPRRAMPIRAGAMPRMRVPAGPSITGAVATRPTKRQAKLNAAAHRMPGARRIFRLFGRSRLRLFNFSLMAFSDNIVNGSRELSTIVHVDTIDTGTFEEMTRDERTSPHRYNSAQLCGWHFDFGGNGGMWDRFALLERQGDRERRKVQSQRTIGRS
jgi:hypothetical protein